jgi:hydrogenase-1 operon protein HyaF
MSSLDNIPVRVEQTPTPDDFALVQSILHEIHAMLERLLAEGEEGAIDLRGFPTLNPASLALLETWLPLGEVSAVITGVGRTEVRETAYTGVWWLVYRNEDGDVVTESILVTEVPEILKSQKEDIELGLRKFSRILSATEKQEFVGQTAD